MKGYFYLLALAIVFAFLGLKKDTYPCTIIASSIFFSASIISKQLEELKKK